MDPVCGLCQNKASLHCSADDAFLCWACDAKVHGANFLVARHLRALLCQNCSSPTAWLASGPQFPPVSDMCSLCLDSKQSRESRGFDKVFASEAIASAYSSTDPKSILKIDIWKKDMQEQEDYSCAESSGKSCLSSGTVSSDVSDTFFRLGSEESISVSSDSTTTCTDSSWDLQSNLKNGHSSATTRVKRILANPRARSCGFYRPIESTDLIFASMSRVLRKWQRSLKVGSHVFSLAMKLFKRIFASLKVRQLDRLYLVISLAACLWISCRLEGGNPEVMEFEKCTGVPHRALSEAENVIRRLLNHTGLQSKGSPL